MSYYALSFLVNSRLRSRRPVLFLSSVGVQPVPLPPACSSNTLPLLSFQSLTTIKFCNSFVLPFIQNAGGCGGCCAYSTLRPPELRMFQRVFHLSLLICTFVFNHFHDASPVTLFRSCFCIVARGCTYPSSLVSVRESAAEPACL